MTQEDDSLCLHIAGGDGSRKYFPLDGERMIIGRDAASAILLADPSISKQHAVVTFDGRRTLIEDGVDGTPSANGVYVNENKIEVATRIGEGNVIKMGVFRFEVRRTHKVREALLLKEVHTKDDLVTFLSSGEIHAVHDDDIHDIFRSLNLEPKERMTLFDTAEEKAESENDAHRSSALARLRKDSVGEEEEDGIQPQPHKTEKRGQDILAISFFVAIAVLLGVIVWGVLP